MYKRFEVRRKTQIPIEVITSLWDEPLKLVAEDLSPRGTYVISEMMPNLGEHIVCAFLLPKIGEELTYFGEVSRINWFRRKTDKGMPGFGVSFLDTTPMDRIKIREALQGLPPPLPMQPPLPLGRCAGVTISRIITV
jgi:hypothetical protein